MNRLYAPQSELAVLSSFLNRLDQGWLGHIERTVKDAPHIFADPKNRAVYTSAQTLVDKGRAPDVALIADYLDNHYSSLFPDGAGKYILDVQLSAPIAHLDQFTSTLEELSQLRQLRDQVKNIESILQDITMDDVDRAEKSKYNKNISEQSLTPADIAHRLTEIAESAETVLSTKTFGEIATEVLESEQAAWTQTTTIPKLDKILGGQGFESGCLTIIAARPKVGKTILMNSLTKSVLDGGAYPIVLNYETKDIEFVAKMIARHLAEVPEDDAYIDADTQFDNNDLGWGIIKQYLFATKEQRQSSAHFSPLTAQRIEEGIAWAREQDWFVSFDKNMSMQDITSLIREERARREEGAKIILFVDYLQLQVGNAFKEREEITQLTRFYKKLAGEYKIAVVCLSQMNRDGSDNMEVKNLRGSGSIEQDADTIIMLDRPSRKDENASHNILNVFAGTTRLAEGDNFNLFIDGATNLVAQLPDDIMSELEQSSQDAEYEGDSIF